MGEMREKDNNTKKIQAWKKNTILTIIFDGRYSSSNMER
jgi:hypothetical protein